MILTVLLTALAVLAAFHAVQLVRSPRVRGEFKPKAEGVAIVAAAADHLD